MTREPITAPQPRQSGAAQLPDEAERAEQLHRTWQTPSGLIGSLAAVNNQVIGKRFMLTAFAFFLVGGVLALLMRVQLAVPDNTFLGPDVYNQIFTMHGSTMMYLFAVPFLEGLAIYLLPLMIGSRDLAFPRLTAFGYWTYLFGGLVFYSSFLVGNVPEVGWFAYTPLSEAQYSGLGTDFWLLGLTLVEVSGITAGAEIVVTALRMRAPGMTIGRMPLLVWAFLTIGVMILFAFTTLLTATVLLEMDRSALSTRFFDPVHGGSPLLWQHLFWFFGHPEVYIIFLPATGIVSMVVTAFAGRLVGYVLVATAIVVTGFISFGLWVHHMYTTGLPALSMSFFAAASLMIAVASGTQVFAWIASLWGSRPQLKTPLLWVLGFVFIFVLGGLTGVMIAVVPFDWQVHDSYFIVAHFHYVLIGGAVFPIFAGLYFWLPKITGRLLDERLGKWAFWLTFIGFNLTFFPMHKMGLDGMRRRVYTYPEGVGLEWQNLLATGGAFVLAAGFLVFAVDFLRSLRSGRPAGPSPWGGDSLEWSVTSPPQVYSFDRPPVVWGRHAQWATAPAAPGGAVRDWPKWERAADALADAPEGWRATLGTDALTARPDAVYHLPGPTYLPLLASLGLVLASVGVLVQAYLLGVLGLLFSAAVFIAWLRPNQEAIDMLRASHVPRRAGLPVFTTGARSLGWWGAVCLIAALATVLATLLYSYFYIRLYSPIWPQGDIRRPAWVLPLLTYALLGLGAAALWGAGYALRKGHQLGVEICLAGALAAGILFLGLQVYLLVRIAYPPSANAYASLVYALNWLAFFFVLSGAAMAGAALVRVVRKGEEPGQLALMALQVQVTGMFWYFVAVSGAAIFGTLYVSPYLL